MILVLNDFFFGLQGYWQLFAYFQQILIGRLVHTILRPIPKSHTGVIFNKVSLRYHLLPNIHCSFIVVLLHRARYAINPGPKLKLTIFRFLVEFYFCHLFSHRSALVTLARRIIIDPLEGRSTVHNSIVKLQNVLKIHNNRRREIQLHVPRV